MLAVDANILLSIASDQKAKNLVDALRTWMFGLAGKVHPEPRGKTVTVLVTKCMLHDYWTGLRRGGYGVDQGTKKASVPALEKACRWIATPTCGSA